MALSTGEKMKRRREQLGKPQSDIAAALGVPQSRISKWEIGEGEPGPTQMFVIARSLQCSLDYLCDPDAGDDYGVYRELSREERLVADLVEKMGAAVALDRLLALPPSEKKRAEQASDEKPAPPVSEGPSDGRPVSPRRIKPGTSTE